MSIGALAAPYFLLVGRLTCSSLGGLSFGLGHPTVNRRHIYLVMIIRTGAQSEIGGGASIYHVTVVLWMNIPDTKALLQPISPNSRYYT